MDLLNTCAQIAGRVYPRPKPQPDVQFPTAGASRTLAGSDSISGFSAGVYRSGNESDHRLHRHERKHVAGFRPANVPAALGMTSAQVVEAAALVIETLGANPGATITFTGHSLGGGLASVMAVLFDRPAMIFDPAPSSRR